MRRRRPDLGSLAAELQPERFVWRILPHAARSFAASIVVLPVPHARAAAVAYLYCRMLDAYEDLWPEPETRVAALRGFAARFDSADLPAPTPIPATLADGDRDLVHLLLVERCEHVDAVYATLPTDVRERIAALVSAMSEGMAWSATAFDRQGGVLEEDQLARYCRNVIGHPVLFVIGLISERDPPAAAREDALLVSEMLQLANVTRDLEADLARGVAYHPSLKPYLGRDGLGAQEARAILEVRERYTAVALSHVAAYRRLYAGLGLGESAPVRLGAVLMLLFTDLHYRGCMTLTGRRPWPGSRGRFDVVARSLPALLSPRLADRTMRGVEREFLEAARGLELAAARVR